MYLFTCGWKGDDFSVKWLNNTAAMYMESWWGHKHTSDIRNITLTKSINQKTEAGIFTSRNNIQEMQEIKTSIKTTNPHHQRWERLKQR